MLETLDSSVAQEVTRIVERLEAWGFGDAGLFDQRLRLIAARNRARRYHSEIEVDILRLADLNADFYTSVLNATGRVVSTIEADADRSRLLTLVLLPTTAALAFLIWRQLVLLGIVRPLGRVETAMLALANGAEAVELPERRSDELGRIAGALDVLAGYVRRVVAAERALAEKDTILTTALNTMSDSFVVLDADLNFRAFNNRYLAITDLIGVPRSLVAVGAPYARVAEAMALSGALGPGDPRQLVNGWMATVGERKPRRQVAKTLGLWFETRKEVLRDGGFVFLTADITALKEREVGLAAAEERVRTVMENVADGIITIDSKGIIQSVNMAVSGIFRYPRDELIGRNVSMLMTEGDAAAHDGRIRRYEETGEGRIIDMGARQVTGRRRDGSTFFLDLSVGVADVSGTRAYVGVVRDITERVEAERRIAEQQALISAIVEATPVPLVALNADAEYLLFNEKYRRLMADAGIPGDMIEAGRQFRPVAETLHRLGFGEGRISVDDNVAFYTRREEARLEISHLGRHYDVRKSLLPESGTVVLLSDVTEERQAGELLTTAMAALPDALMVLDGDLKMQLHNERMRQILEQSQVPAELIANGLPYGPMVEAALRGSDIPETRIAQVLAERLAFYRRPEDEEEVIRRGGRWFDMRKVGLPDGRRVVVYTDVTEEREARELLATTMEAMPDGLLVIDADTRIVMFNQRYIELATSAGVPEALIAYGRPYADLVSAAIDADGFTGAEATDRLLSRLAFYLSPGESQQAATYRGRWFDTRKVSLPDGRRVIVMSDITAERSAQEQLKAAIDNMADGFVLIDPDLRYRLFNRRYVELAQAVGSPAELIVEGAPILDSVVGLALGNGLTEAGVQAMVAQRRRFYGGPQPDQMEIDTPNALIDLRKAPLPGGGAVVLISDLTERRDAERRLHEAEERRKFALAAAGAHFWTDDLKDNSILYDSPLFFTQYGYPESEIPASIDAYVDLIHPDDVPATMQSFEAHARGERPFHEAEFRFRRKDGSWVWTLNRGRITERDRAGGAVKIAGITLDIDARKTAEQQLSEALGTISSSIGYAARIQAAILPDPAFMAGTFDDHFIIWQPRDVVGGDVYFCEPWGDRILVGVGDCTGHGVPGAFMTMIATSALRRALAETEVGELAQLVGQTHRLIRQALSRDADSEVDDGMEIGLCAIDRTGGRMQFCGAGLGLIAIDRTGPRYIRGARSGIGYASTRDDAAWPVVEIEMTGDSLFYITTDGMPDQVGGPKRRGFGRQRVIDSLCSAAEIGLHEQAVRLLADFRSWQGDEERRDDICALGFRVAKGSPA